MAKKVKPLSKINPFKHSKHQRNKASGIHNSRGDMNILQYLHERDVTLCFICLEKRGTLASTGKYVCTRCRREHGYG